MPFVIDASIALTWCFDDETTPFSEFVLDLLIADAGRVPAIQPYEVANALILAERRGRIRRDGTDQALERLQALPIEVDNRPVGQVWSSALDVARSMRLTTYDASYLDLAIRERLPLATLDARMSQAARRAGVALIESGQVPLAQGRERAALSGATTTIPVQSFKAELISLFDETFANVSGHYLDRGTSLFETLASIDAAQASTPLSDSCGTIAAQVNHIAFYLDVINRYFQGDDPGKVDWDASWDVGAVTDAEWTALKSALRDAHARTRALLVAQTDFSTDTDRIGEAMAFVVHTAYHLGEVRQALCAIRGGAS